MQAIQPRQSPDPLSIPLCPRVDITPLALPTLTRAPTLIQEHIPINNPVLAPTRLPRALATLHEFVNTDPLLNELLRRLG